jgi:hypothetical protein
VWHHGSAKTLIICLLTHFFCLPFTSFVQQFAEIRTHRPDNEVHVHPSNGGIFLELFVLSITNRFAFNDWYNRTRRINMRRGPRNTQLSHNVYHCYMFRHYRVIIGQLVIITLQNYTSISLVPKVAGSLPAEAVRFFKAKKKSTAFGRELNPFAPCRRFASCKGSR